MEAHWNRYVRVVNHHTVPHFHDYHSGAAFFVAVMGRCRGVDAQPQSYGSGTYEVSKLLNEAWREFLSIPPGIRKLQASLMDKTQDGSDVIVPVVA
jgi:hypothetical protein